MAFNCFHLDWRDGMHVKCQHTCMPCRRRPTGQTELISVSSSNYIFGQYFLFARLQFEFERIEMAGDLTVGIKWHSVLNVGSKPIDMTIEEAHVGDQMWLLTAYIKGDVKFISVQKISSSPLYSFMLHHKSPFRSVFDQIKVQLNLITLFKGFFEYCQ